MFEIEDEKNAHANGLPIVNVKVPTEFPHNFHVHATVWTCGLWLPFYVLHFILAYLISRKATR
jgi:hypothetical protein